MNCPSCGSQRATNVYCWHCEKPLPPFDIETFMKSDNLEEQDSNGKEDTTMLGVSKEKKKRKQRSRNKNGRWRKKRSDTGKPRRKKE